jgi:hypothetical protein
MVNRATSVPVNAAPLDSVSGTVSVPARAPAQTISAVLVDDEKLARDRLVSFLRNVDMSKGLASVVVWVRQDRAGEAVLREVIGETLDLPGGIEFREDS